LLFAIPVCGPYTAMTNYKFKVKLTPGNMKKGKAGRLALEIFSKLPEASQRERDLVKAIPENDLIQTIVAEVKISTPGLFKSTKGKGKKP